MWLGAALLAALVVAPHAFAILPSRAEAGDFIGAVLLVVNLGAIGTGLFAAGASVMAGRRRKTRTILATAMAIAGAISLRLQEMLASMRAAIDPIDALAPDDPRRLAFGAWHAVSMVVLLIAVILALGTIAADYSGTSSVSGNRQP